MKQEYPKLGISKILKKLGKKETDIVCLPEQWLKIIRFQDFDSEFSDFKKIAKDYSMTIIPGAFYEGKIGKDISIITNNWTYWRNHRKQEKIHPFDYERDTSKTRKRSQNFQYSMQVWSDNLL